MSLGIILTVFFLLNYGYVISGKDSSPHVTQLHQAIDFWTDAVCSMHHTKTINFHAVFAFDSSPVLEFFDLLVRNVGKRCEAVIALHTCAIEFSKNSTGCLRNVDVARGRVHESEEWQMRPKNVSVLDFAPSKIQTERQPRHGGTRSAGKKEYIDVWRINVIVSSAVRRFDEIFDYEFSVGWKAIDHFVVLSFADDEYVEWNQPSETIVEVLKGFWYWRKIHNVLLSAPLSGRMDVMYSYNPFAKIDEFGWGKVEVIDVKSAKHVFRVLATLTPSRTADLQGYKLNVGMFEHFQMVYKVRERLPPGSIYEYSGGYNGSDGIILGTMAKYMNFTVNAIEPADGMKFGFQLPNGTYIGTMGDVVYGKVNVSFMSYYVKMYSRDTSAMEFSTHVEFDKVCVIVPKAPKVPKWLRLYHIFAPSVWIFSIMLQIVLYLTWHLLQIFVPHRSKDVSIQMTLYRSILLNSGCPIKLPTSNSERILVASVFLASVTMLGTINGILYKSFTQDMFYKDIDRLQQLDKSGLPIVFEAFGMDDLFGDQNDPETPKFMKSLGAKLRHGKESITYTAFFRNTTSIMRQQHYQLVREELVDEEGSHLLHLCKECPGSFYLAYLLPRHSILRERIDVLIGRLNQAGLPMLWIQQNIDRLIEQKRSVQPYYKNKSFVPFRLKDLQISFYTLAIGLTIATIVFLVERIPIKRLIARIYPRDWKNLLITCSCRIYRLTKKRTVL